MQRQLSRHLIGLWATNNEPANQLMERILPAGLLQHLHSEDPVPTSEKDRLHVRDNLSLAVTGNMHSELALCTIFTILLTFLGESCNAHIQWIF